MKMNLWVRSQDKRILIKVDNVFLNANYDNKRISTYDGDSDTTLGEYKTKERAIEVLDEIEKLIKPITIFQNCQVDKSAIEKIKEIGYCMVNDDARVEQISQAFYQMPEN